MSQTFKLKQSKTQTEGAYCQTNTVDKEVMALSGQRSQLYATMYKNTLAVDSKLVTSISSCQDSANSVAQAFPEVVKHFVMESEKLLKQLKRKFSSTLVSMMLKVKLWLTSKTA